MLRGKANYHFLGQVDFNLLFFPGVIKDYFYSSKQRFTKAFRIKNDPKGASSLKVNFIFLFAFILIFPLALKHIIILATLYYHIFYI